MFIIMLFAILIRLSTISHLYPMDVKNDLTFQFYSTRLEINQAVGMPAKPKPFKKKLVDITIHSSQKKVTIAPAE